MYKLFSKNEWQKTIKNKIMNAWVGAIPVGGEIQEWLQSLIVRLNWLNELSQWSWSVNNFVIGRVTLNYLIGQERLCNPFVMLVTISCLIHRCFHLHWYFIVPLRDTRVNNTCPVGRYRKIWTVLRTNQIAGFVSVPSKKKLKISIQWMSVTKYIALSIR